MSVLSPQLRSQIRQIEIRTDLLVRELFSGVYRASFRGRGMDFEDLRQYAPGDEIRHINWNVTARVGEPFIKVFREERQLTVNLLVDLSGSGQLGSTLRTKRERMAELAGVLAMAATRNRDRVGLLLFTDHIEQYIPPGVGRQHVLRVIREVLGFEPTRRGTDLAEALSYLSRVQHRRSIAFLISDFLDHGYERAVKVTARRHDLVAVIASDPLERTLPDVGIVRMEDAETGDLVEVDTGSRTVRQAFAAAARERRSRLLDLFKRSGTDVIELEHQTDLVRELRRFFDTRLRRR